MAKYVASGLPALADFLEREANNQIGGAADGLRTAAQIVRETEIPETLRPIQCQTLARGNRILGGFIG